MKQLIRFLILTALGLSLQGCAYLQDRGNDAKDIIDIGLTVSGKPQFAFYYDFVPIIPIGYGNVEGQFTGLGGGQFAGGAPHTQKSTGLILWGEEQVNFGTSPEALAAMDDAERNKALDIHRTGLIGMAQGPFPDTDYLISCPHYVHLGWIGVVGSPRYLQMLDFVLGWTTLDIGSDDDRAEKTEELTAQ